MDLVDWVSSPARAAGVVMRAPRMVTVVPILWEVPHEPGTPPREATAYLLARPHGALLLGLVAGATSTTVQTFQTFRRRARNFGGSSGRLAIREQGRPACGLGRERGDRFREQRARPE